MQLTITAMTYGPDGLARKEDGKAVFVSGGITGDVVEARIVEEGASFARAICDEVLEPSPSRTEPACPYAGVCGGCPWAAMRRDAQLAAKEDNLRSTLSRIGRFTPEEVDELVKPIRHAKDAWGYRNKIELAPVHRNGKFFLGMHGRNPDDVIRVDACPLFDKKFPKALKGVAGALGYLGNSRDLELERVGIRASRRTKALEVALWTPTGGFPRGQVSRVLADSLNPTSVVRVMSKGDRRARKIAGSRIPAGRGFVDGAESGREEMRLSAPSFFQREHRRRRNPDRARPRSPCSRGARGGHRPVLRSRHLTLPLARRCEYVAAVEAYGPAVRDLRRNLEIARLDNVDVIGGDAVREFPDEDADVLVVDPPRAGLAAEAIDLSPPPPHAMWPTFPATRHPRARPAPLCRRRHLRPRKRHAGRPVPADISLRDFVVHLTRSAYRTALKPAPREQKKSSRNARGTQEFWV